MLIVMTAAMPSAMFQIAGWQTRPLLPVHVETLPSVRRLPTELLRFGVAREYEQHPCETIASWSVRHLPN
ncbi:hypothetical protein [Indioceanicola profundi]|uniref:hypothetical protein n=1 Tax=Indioceanicola profundi TaxID=2220096 RepID=UPI0013C4A056|nr:hypothetical protein [Indioceanicola profundi]